MRTSTGFASVTLAAALAAVLPVSASEENPPDTQLKQAQTLVKAFVGQLQPQLKAALKNGGPTYAIEVCANTAPAIADSLAQASGWSVSRVSLQPRNPSRAQPDEWEKAILERFDERAAAGEAPANINYGATVDGRYRYMQAQGVQPICLTCHGETLSPDVAAALQQYYPDDTATGYTAGQLRGAISVSAGCDNAGQTSLDGVCDTGIEQDNNS
tara:strand:- start:87259 stop:87900 length:642 start_codon:yes stop_codon:yes gene_type:complete